MNWLFSKIKGDGQIWLIVLLLTIFSVMVVYSSTGSLAYVKHAGNTEYYLFRQLGFIILGLLFMFGAHRINYIYYSRIAQLLVWISIPLLLLTYLFGPSINEAKRWLFLPGTNLTFQPSDFAKLAIIMYLARFLSKKQDVIKDFKKAFLPMIIWVLITCLIIAPSDLSTALLIFVSSIFIMFIGRVSIKHISLFIFGTAVITFLGIFLAIQLNAPGRIGTWESRISNYMNDDSEISYQAQQSKIAIAKGELFGSGPGHSRQKNFLGGCRIC